MADVTLVPMTAADLEQFIAEEIADCADEGVSDGRWARCDAIERARADLKNVVDRERRAISTDGHRLFTAVTATGERVGWLWAKRSATEPAENCVFLCQMTIARARRRQGFGRAMLRALEALFAEEGVTELRMNVWESNLPAKRLYASAGYELVTRCETIRQLRKRLVAAPALA